MANATSFRQGESGNPAGRPKGIERYARELVGDDGKRLADFWLKVMDNPDARMPDRLKASEMLAQRAFGKPPQTLELGGEGGGPVRHEHKLRLTLQDVIQLADVLGVNGSS